jgi:MFS family permease
LNQDERPGRSALVALALSLVLAMATWFSASAVIPQLRSEWGLSDSTAAWLTIAVQLGFVVGAVTSSIFNLPDIVAPQRVMLLSALGAAGVNLLLVTVDSGAGAVPLRFATGFFLAGIYPPALKLIATWFKRGRGLAFGVLIGALTLGSASPHLVNGAGGLEWEVVVIVTSLMTVLGGLIAARVKEGPYPFARAVFDPRQAGRAFHNRGVRLASLGYFGHMWELYAMWAWFVVFFRTSLEGGTTTERGETAAFATFAVIGIGALGCWAGGMLGDRWGRTRTTALMMTVSGTCAVLVGFLYEGPTAALLAISLVWGLSVVGDSAQFSSIVTELGDQAYVGTALTLQLALGFTLTVATIWLIPVLETRFGWQWAFAFLAPGPALGVVAMLRLRSLPEAAQIAGGRG